MDSKKDSSINYMLHVIPAMKAAAYACGYALTTHGSMMRDIDLVAIPWTDTAKSPRELIRELSSACGGFVPVNGKIYHHPHKRISVAMFVTGSIMAIDLSIILRSVDKVEDF